jgi:prephenate dehydrogenase
MKTAVIGLGLIGGSLLRALAAEGHDLTGFDADPATRELARAGGYRVADSVAEAVRDVELTALAVPLPVLPKVLAELAGHDGLVTDVTSVKGPVRDLMVAHGVRRFVGGHPMAGKEISGFAAADPDLFAGCAWVLCLEPHGTDLDDWMTLARLFTAMGSRVVPVTASEHDTAVARISHVPHLFAATLARQLAGDPLAGALAAGSFRDGTRVAGTRAEMIAAMCGGNAEAVRTELRSLIGFLGELDALLASDDPVGAVIPPLHAAGELRRSWPPAPGEPEKMRVSIPALLELGRAGGWVTSVDHDEVVVLRPQGDRKPA